MRGSRPTTIAIACAAALAALLAAPARAADFRDEALIKCVEGGGIYHDDGHCEGGKHGDAPPPAPDPGAEAAPGAEAGTEAASADQAQETARRDCRRRGGRWRSDGTCEVRGDPVERCEGVGGLFMVDGKCYRPER